jgi:hypothetical protein
LDSCHKLPGLSTRWNFTSSRLELLPIILIKGQGKFTHLARQILEFHEGGYHAPFPARGAVVISRSAELLDYIFEDRGFPYNGCLCRETGVKEIEDDCRNK